MGSMAQRAPQKTTHPQGFVKVCPSHTEVTRISVGTQKCNLPNLGESGEEISIKHEAQLSPRLQESPSAFSFQSFPRLLWRPVTRPVSEERDHCRQVRVKDREWD